MPVIRETPPTICVITVARSEPLYLREMWLMIAEATCQGKAWICAGCARVARVTVVSGRDLGASATSRVRSKVPTFEI